MRVDLPQTGKTDSAPGASPEPLVPAARQRRISRLDHLLITLTRWRVAGPLAGAALALFVWTVAVRMPASSRYLKIHARMQAMSGSNLSPGERPVTSTDVASLQGQLAAFSRDQIVRRRDLLPLLNQLEANAQDLGWKCDRALRAAQAAPNGVTNLVVHPVDLRLTRSGNARAGAYPRLLAWLDGVGKLPKHAKIVAIDLHSDAGGISGVDVKLHFFTLHAHEETAAE